MSDISFHSRIDFLVTQEILARFIFYNICSSIVRDAAEVVEESTLPAVIAGSPRPAVYWINRNNADAIIRGDFLSRKATDVGLSRRVTKYRQTIKPRTLEGRHKRQRRILPHLLHRRNRIAVRRLKATHWAFNAEVCMNVSKTLVRLLDWAYVGTSANPEKVSMRVRIRRATLFSGISERNMKSWFLKIRYLKNLVLGLLLLVVGIVLIFGDVLGWLETDQDLLLNVGCSLMASAIVILATAVLVEREPNLLLQEWELTNIYGKRNAKEADSYADLEKTHEHIDIVAFGLRTFRSDKKNVEQIKRCLEEGAQIRILTMDPDSQFVERREQEEKCAKDHIRDSIVDLIEWANEMNSKGYTGRITVKGYTCMTLDFYWRLDDVIYVGAYPYGLESDQAPTYRYTKGGKGFDLYFNYFIDLWNNEEFQELTSTETRQ